MSAVYTELMTENAQLRAENAALRCAMEAIRTLTGMVEIPAVPPLDQAAPAPEAEASPEAAPEAEQEPKIRFLEDLKKPAFWPYGSKAKRNGQPVEPYWSARLVRVDELVRVTGTAFWRPFEGPVTVLDRSGAGLAAASCVEVAHGQLTEAGERRPFEGLPGYYQVPWFPWAELGTPHPLGGAAREAERVGHVWVPHTRVGLLVDLIAQDRYPEIGDLACFVNSVPVRLDRWTRHINQERAKAIDTYGRGPEYEAVKEGFSSAVSLMKGATEGTVGKRVWQTNVQRPDWWAAIHDFQAVTMWRWLDDLNQVAAMTGNHALAPVAVQNKDELVIPATMLEIFTTTNRPGGRKPLVIDQTGKKLGTFKVAKLGTVSA